MVRRVACAVMIVCLLPMPTWAWGAAAHRFVIDRAIDVLPSDLKPFFDAHREELSWRVNDPDLWRVVGWDEGPHHFLDFGADEFGPYPFQALPREYDRAVEVFGVETLKRNGLLPWRFAEMYGHLRRAFADVAANRPFAVGNLVLFAATAAHYIQDAHQPLHATIDFDGQRTGQRGIHARFETELFERFQSRLRLRPAAPAPMTAPRDTAFDILLESYGLVPRVLEADQAAAGGRTTYDARYYDAFFSRAQGLLERRLGDAITATASMIVGAWVEAGRPALRVSSRVPAGAANR